MSKFKQVKEPYNSFSDCSSLMKVLKTGPIGPLESALRATLLSSSFFFYLSMSRSPNRNKRHQGEEKKQKNLFRIGKQRHD